MLTTPVGYPQAFGVLQDYYLSNGQFKGDRRVVFVGTLSMSIPEIGAPLLSYIVEKFPRYRRVMIVVGWLICVGSLVASSFAKTMPILIITQGLLYGLGELILFYPLLSLVNEWWFERMGLAYGVLDCSTGFSGKTLLRYA